LRWYPGAVNAQPLLNIVLYQPEIPPNTGNVGRTCVAVSAKLWLVRPLGFRMDVKSLRRAGLDYWQHLDWEAVDDWETLLPRLPNQRMWLLSKHATKLYTDVEYHTGDTLVFGSETNGLPKSLLESHPDQTLRIPMQPIARCLNLASSVAAVAYEARRQLTIEQATSTVIQTELER
jgi:tRNA (cytidine/uridine-2'-O-)-methyltransferase